MLQNQYKVAADAEHALSKWIASGDAERELKISLAKAKEINDTLQKAREVKPQELVAPVTL